MSTNYPPKFYKEGLEMCLENSRSLLEIAGDAAERKKYGIANSLAVLATEEARSRESFV